MQRFEYKVVPAPLQGQKARGLRTTSDRFAHALTLTMNELASAGWEYLRADTLPCEERKGFTGRSTTFQHMLVFRRELPSVLPQAIPAVAHPVFSHAPLSDAALDRANRYGAGEPDVPLPKLGPAEAVGTRGNGTESKGMAAE